jgi:arylsulfatase A-like enzyme
MVDHTDLFATLLDYADVALPADAPHRYPGRSFRGMLQDGRGLSNWKTTQFAEYGPVRMARTQQHKLVLREPLGANELYDLGADPAENHNRYDKLNEIAVRLAQESRHFFRLHHAPGRDGALGEVLRQHNYVEAWRGEKE